MTIRNQSFEGGTNGATLAVGNMAGSGDTAPSAAPIIAGASTLAFDSTLSSQGTLSAKFSPASGQSVSWRWTGMSSTAFAASVYVYLTTAPTADLFLFNTVAGGVSTMRATLTVSSGAAKLSMLDTRGTGTRVWTAAAAFPLNQWVRIESYHTVNAGAATYQAAYYLGDSTTATDSVSVTNANTGSTAIDTLIVGKTDSSTYVSPFWIDGVQSNDAATGMIGRWPATPASTVRPGTVISNAGAFSNAGGAADIAAALADESDTTFAQSPDNPAGASCEVKFAAPLTAGLVTVKARHMATAASPTITRTYSLKQGSTVISTRSVTLPTTATDYTFTTTSTEAGNITDRSDLRLFWSDTV